jgi:hypothetical protein
MFCYINLFRNVHVSSFVLNRFNLLDITKKSYDERKTHYQYYIHDAHITPYAPFYFFAIDKFNGAR